MGRKQGDNKQEDHSHDIIIYELQSKLLVSPLISPIILPYIVPYISRPLRSLDNSSDGRFIPALVAEFPEFYEMLRSTAVNLGSFPLAVRVSLPLSRSPTVGGGNLAPRRGPKLL